MQLASRTNEVWAVISNNGNVDNNPCESVIQLAEDIVDKWPHSVPPLSVTQVLKNKPPDQVFCFTSISLILVIFLSSVEHG
jgi:hypothetical protein